LPLASTTLKADGESGKYDKMLLLQLARGSNTSSVHCNHSDIYYAFNKKMRFCCFFSMASTSLKYKCIIVLFLVSILVLLGRGSFPHTSTLYAQGSIECDRQTFSPVDCHTSSSGQEELNNDNENDDRGNIEEQIPSVIPFP
jgi:hypothetical protein